MHVAICEKTSMDEHAIIAIALIITIIINTHAVHEPNPSSSSNLVKINLNIREFSDKLRNGLLNVIKK